MELNVIKGRIEKMKKNIGLEVQQLWDIFFFEQFLFRLVNSNYKNQFIFKGGFLLQNIVGIETRTTMDIDFKVVSTDLNEEKLFKILNSICDNNIDEIRYKVIGISNIKAETKYAGKTAKIEAKFYNIKKIFNVDLGFGDIVTPYAKNYRYKSIVADTDFSINAYPIETIIAEKFETIISKGVNNSRSKDLLDIYLLNKCTFDNDVLNSALVNTFYLRNTSYEFDFIKDTLNKVFSFENTLRLYENYRKKHKFATDVSLDMCKDAVYSIFSKLTFNEKINLKDYGIELHLVRHGQDEVDKIGGWSDNHLTVEGKNQIKHLISDIDENYDIFISSDLNRAKETALIINEKLKMNVIYDSNYRETNNGELKNLTKEEFEHKYPELYFSSLDMNQRYPGGESPNEFYNRVKNAFMELLENNRNKKILLVTHGGVITVILSLLNGYKYNNNLKMAPKTASILKLK